MTARRAAILQSSYIPWKGYFDIIAAVDLFILFDDVQFTRRDWRTRNRIKTAQGVQWLTVPVQARGRYADPIDAIETVPGWAEAHWTRIRHAYARASHFAAFAPGIEAAYAEVARLRRLSAVNRTLLERLCGVLGITTPIVWSRDLGGHGRRTERLVSLCQAVGATTYLSGPSAASYIEPALFADAGISLEWMDYRGYAAYPQLHGEFVHEVSMLDLLFNAGPEAPRYMKFAR